MDQPLAFGKTRMKTKKKEEEGELQSPVVEEEEEPLSPVARVFQQRIDCCIVTIIGCKTKITPHILLHALKHNVSKHPRFSSKLSDDGARWIKTEVNVEDHVFVPHIDTDETVEDGERFVDDYISRLTTIPLHRSKPLWDIHILNVKTSDAEAICVVRSHHSLGDGMSLMSLLVACTRKTSDPEAFPTFPALKRRENVVRGGNIGWLVMSIISTVKLIWNTVVDLLLVLATILFLKDTETPLKGGACVESNPKRFTHRILSLDDIRLIKNVMNMTLNDVLLGVTQTALSRYLNRRYGETNMEDGNHGPSKSDQNNLPSRILLRTGIPVNLRSDIGIQPLADMMAKDSRCRWGNYMGFIFLPFSIGLEPDPLVYLLKSKSVMDRKKHSFEASLSYRIIQFIINFKTFGAKVGEALSKRIASSATTFVSNIAGPVEEVCFHGHPIAYIALSVYGSPQALFIHFISYAEKMVVSIAVDPTVIPDPHRLCDDVEEVLKEMKVAVSASKRGLL